MFQEHSSSLYVFIIQQKTTEFVKQDTNRKAVPRGVQFGMVVNRAERDLTACPHHIRFAPGIVSVTWDVVWL